MSSLAPRWFAAPVLLVALTAAQAQGFPGGGASPFRSARTSETVALAEAALAQGDAPLATELFERAASQEHASDIEVGLVRSLVQAGEYRKALAFAAHTAGAHADQTAGAALYAWLLAVGGQSAFALRLLAEVEQRRPGDPLIGDLKQRLQPAPAQPQALPAPPARFAPAGALLAGARTVSSGLLVDQGRRAIAPFAALSGASRIWVRDGLGRTVSARLERHIDELGLAVLELHTVLTLAPDVALPERDPFPGTPAHAIEYAPAPDAAPAWPWLQSGFLGTVDPASGARRLGIGLPPGPRGGPLFDAGGRLIGLAMAQAGPPDRLLPASALSKALGSALGARPAPPAASSAAPPAPPPAPPRMAVDELYERGLRLTLQIVTAP